MLNDGKKQRGRYQPCSQGCRLVNHYRDELDDWKNQGKGLVPPGGEDRRSLG